ncbi:MAG: recombination-associated protein RdgC [Rhodoferax sp.]|nr:recombination-associated protein RdgC [Rhodoferax sp.]
MFKSASIFRISTDFTLPQLAVLEEALQSAQFLHCAPTQPEACGWIAPRGKKSTVLAEAVGGTGVILRLQTERRQLPASAVKDTVDAMIEIYKQQTGHERVGAKIKKEFKEEAVQTLLPRAFPKRSSVTLWIDPVNHWLVVDSASLAGADKVVSQLVEVLAAIPDASPIIFRPLQTVMTPANAMAHWLASREAPYAFTVDRDCELKTSDDQKSAVRYSRHTLEINEVAEHVASGKVPTKLAMTWNDRVSLVLSDMGQLNKIEMLNMVLDDKDAAGKDDDGFDADAAITTGELAALIPDLIEALGGELVDAPHVEVLTPPPEGQTPLDGELDPLYEQAVALVVKHQKASISLVQRHLNIRYNRSARLLDRMEVEGKVTPMNRSGIRMLVAVRSC